MEGAHVLLHEFCCGSKGGMSSHAECRVTDILTEELMEPEVEGLIFSMTVAAVRTIDHHAQEVVMDDEYACSDTSDVLYCIMILK
jgi:hypothetical protein